MLVRLFENVMVLNTKVSNSIVTSTGYRPRIIGLWNNNSNVRAAGIVNPIMASTDPWHETVAQTDQGAEGGGIACSGGNVAHE